VDTGWPLSLMLRGRSQSPAWRGGARHYAPVRAGRWRFDGSAEAAASHLGKGRSPFAGRAFCGL